jgi:hypothetical protein
MLFCLHFETASLRQSNTKLRRLQPSKARNNLTEAGPPDGPLSLENGVARKDSVYEDYVRLNTVLNSVFFDGRYKFKAVYLDLEDGIFKEVADRLGLGPLDLEPFIGLAVAETLSSLNIDPYTWHISEARRWAKNGRAGPPPFTGVLITLSLAAEKMRADGQFSATNYYERLFEVLEVADSSLKSGLRSHARSTRYFWRELNHWLVETDFEYGRPTARQVNNWAYVSYALSQALIREEERKRFHLLFSEFNLSPLDDVSESEMMLFLQDWMTGSGPNGWLRKLWGTPDLRERVAASALTELEMWDGGQEEGGKKRRRLTWTAYFKTFPRKQLKLLLSTVGPEACDHVKLQVPQGVTKAAAKAFEGTDHELLLASVPTGEFSVLEPTNEINLGALLLASFELDAETGDAFAHVARPIIPLAKLETGTYYREVQRITVLRRHAVLCHEQWVSMAKSHLTKCARPGFKLYQTGELAGLPPGWALFDDVEITRVLDDASTNMAVLVPLSEGIAIQLEGGLRLAPQIWHSRARPTVIASGDNDAFDLVIRSHATDEDEEVHRERSKAGSSYIDLARLKELPAQELTAIALRQSKETSERNFALRDGNLPRSIRGVDLAYTLSAASPSAFLSASPPEKKTASTYLVRGMQVLGNAPISGASKPNGAALPGKFVDIEPEQDETTDDYILTSVEGLAETCMIRGYHYWICEEAKKGDIPGEAKRMECKDCHMSVVLRNRLRRRHAPMVARDRTSAKPLAVLAIDNSKRQISLDLIYDGLCYLGTGTWSAFQSLAAAHSEDPWFATSFAQDLHDLGHLDLSRDGTGRVLSWTVSPPLLLVRDDGEAYLAGFRNQHLIKTIEKALAALGCVRNLGVLNSGLAYQAWRNVNPDQAREALRNVTDPHGRKIEVQSSPASLIISLGCTLDQLLAATPSVHLESKDGLQRFDVRKGRWEFATSTREVGAYRTNFAGRRYFVRDLKGTARATGHALAKIFAARNDGIALHGYDERNHQFFGVLGCDLPGLYSRALTSCSGQLPTQDNRRFFYTNVPPTVGTLLLAKLYGKN